MINSSFFQDRSQNFWQLASIQGASASLAGLVLGGQLAAEFGIPTTILSILVGNLILWVIGMAMIGMTATARNNAIANMIRYFGKHAGFVASVILIVAFIIWYVVEIDFAVTAFDNILGSSSSGNLNLILGISFGVFTSLLAIGGIRVIKWICLISLPVLLCFAFYEFFYFVDVVNFNGPWHLSTKAIFATVASTFVGMINLPTFFKHSRSRADSFLGLTLMTVFTVLLEVASIWLRFDIVTDNLSNFVKSDFNYLFIILFIFLSLICINLVNIYFASVGTETIISRLIKFPISRFWEYLIFGLVGTVIFALVRVSQPMLFLVNLAADFLANLGIVIVLAFLVSIIIKHRMRLFEKSINNGCWFIGCLISLIIQIQHPTDSSVAFFSGIGASILAFLIAAFSAETTWSLRQIRAKKIS